MASVRSPVNRVVHATEPAQWHPSATAVSVCPRSARTKPSTVLPQNRCGASGPVMNVPGPHAGLAASRRRSPRRQRRSIRDLLEASSALDASPFSGGRGFDMIVTRRDMVIRDVAHHATPAGNDNLTGAELLARVEAVIAAL